MSTRLSRAETRDSQCQRRADDKRFGDQRDVNVTIFLLGWLYALQEMRDALDRQLDAGAARDNAGGAFALAGLSRTLTADIADLHHALDVVRAREPQEQTN